MAGQTIEKTREVRNGTLRLIVAAIAIVIELVIVAVFAQYFSEQAKWLAVLTRVIAAFTILVIYNTDVTASLKVPWITIIMVAPAVGVALCLLVGENGIVKGMRKDFQKVEAKLFPLLDNDPEASKVLSAVDKRAANISHYITQSSSYPLYDGTAVTYHPDATAGIEAQKDAMRTAQDFIFMEYHAIEDAESWHEVQEILEERAAAGVEVRVFYDDMGSIGFITTDFIGRLRERGIKAKVFNPMGGLLNVIFNNRDHRKITVVDGKVGFTGGYNIANEYFNITHPFGHWKDTGVRLEGPAVRNLTVAFLEMWNAGGDPYSNDDDFARWLPVVAPSLNAQGFVQPYADLPIDDKRVGEDVYISVVEAAQDYAWFVTPYLIITDEMIHAMGLAAQRGVDVRIITPGIPDKKLVYSITRSYYHSLIRNGVRIYEYSPGFCHCKMSVIDDVLATCGTINLDYRSLYHHFENGCMYCDCDAVADTKADFEWMFAQSREVTETYSNPAAGRYLHHLVLRFLAALL